MESSCFERRQGLIFTSLSYRNWKCYSFLSESPTHYTSENRFERFCRIEFFDKPTQRSVFPTFQIKPTQAEVISPWSKDCNILSPNSPIDSTADSIYLGRIVRAFEPGLHHIMCSCTFWKWHIFKFSNGTPTVHCFWQSAVVASMQLQQAKDHSHIFRSRSACGSQIKRNNNLNPCKGLITWAGLAG